MRGRLDAIDWKILRELQGDGRMTNVELARRVGISAPPCLRRVRALEEAGIITGYRALLDAKSLGQDVMAFAMVGLTSQAEADLAAFTSGWFTRGLVTFTAGANAGRAVEVKRHALSGAIATLELWQAPGAAIAPGDTLVVTAGCDKRLATCRERFANTLNFRGFPHMPGNDFLASPLSR